MLSRTITTIILEGSDGVGKDTIAHEMWQDHAAKYRIYVRGELSDYVYAKKYKRAFRSTQRGLPFLYVLLTDEMESIANKVVRRDGCESEDLKKVCDQKLFIDAMNDLKSDYHIIEYSVHDKTPQQCAKEIYALCDSFAASLKEDESINEYNQMYKTGCDQLGIKFSVKNNQPFFDDTMIMADAQLHNGIYETFSDKRCPHNLIFSLGYSNIDINTSKSFDFCYIIGSKINVRQEVNEYLKAFKDADIRCMTKIEAKDKVFGDAYIRRISQAYCTIYTARDLKSLKMITVRPYEAALANQILFVDKESDPDNEILSQIHGQSKYKNLLYVTPETIADTYKNLTQNDFAIITEHQHRWYDRLRKTCLKNKNLIKSYLKTSH